MHALLLVAHGSRVEESNNEVRRLTERVAREGAGRYQWFETAFLELTGPSIEDGVRACVGKGASEITLVPYFLAAGRHVVDDLPEILERMRAEFPAVQMHLVSHIGESRSMPQLVLDCAAQAEADAGTA